MDKNETGPGAHGGDESSGLILNVERVGARDGAMASGRDADGTDNKPGGDADATDNAPARDADGTDGRSPA